MVVLLAPVRWTWRQSKAIGSSVATAVVPPGDSNVYVVLGYVAAPVQWTWRSTKALGSSVATAVVPPGKGNVYEGLGGVAHLGIRGIGGVARLGIRGIKTTGETIVRVGGKVVKVGR